MAKVTTGLEGQLDVLRTINLAATSSLGNSDQTGYKVLWRWTYDPLAFWSINQSNSAGAQQYAYPFAPDRDQLSFIYDIRTTSTLKLTPLWNVEMAHGLRFTSRGSYRRQAGGGRTWGKSGGADQYDLLVHTTYHPLSWLDLDVSGQRFVTQIYTLPGGERRVDAVTYRHTLNAGVNASYRFRGGATLSGALRRFMTWDSSQRNVTPIELPTSTDDDYWQVTTSFRTDLDL
jgi:hypothetical protein